MNRIKIQGNKIKVLEDYYSSDYLAIIILMLIIYYSINGRSTSITLRKIVFIFDIIQKNDVSSKWSTLLSSPWGISDDLRKRIILAYQKQLINIVDGNTNGIVFELTENGTSVINQIEELGILTELKLQVQQTCQKVKLNELKNQDLIW